MIHRAAHSATSFLTRAASSTVRLARAPAAVWCFWFVNMASLLALTLWILGDGRFADAVVVLRARYPAAIMPHLATRVVGLTVVGVLVICSTVGIFIALFVGARVHRRVRSWLAFTVLVAAWLALFASWRELAWRGQALRLRSDIVAFEAVAASLRADWPATDGEHPGIGPFMAYPIGDPRMIMTLTTPELSGTPTTFSTVERGEDALRFQLSGNEAGAWLECHTNGSVPGSFVGGLATDYRLQRAMPLGQGWFLTRYQPVWVDSGASLIPTPGNN